MTKERLPRGEAKHRRRVLSEQRRAAPVPSIEQIARAYKSDSGRLREILDSIGKNSVDPQTRAALTIERYWLEFKLGQIGSAERMSKIDWLLNELEDSHPGVYSRLTEVVGRDSQGRELTRIGEIVQRVMPPDRGRR